MAIELRQQLKLSQQLIMTPQLQMAIRLLQLNRQELIETIQQELEENPALEESQDISEQEQNTEQAELETVDTDSVKEVTIEEKINEDIDWSNYIDEYNSSGKIHFEGEKKDTPSFENFIPSRISLTDHLLWQLRMMFPSGTERNIGNFVIGNLNNDGYLTVSIDEIAENINAPQDEVEKFLSVMQGSLDPAGVCAMNLQESLLIQANRFGINSDIITDIILKYLNHVENKNFKAIATALKISIDDAISMVNLIKGLEPKPGRQFSDTSPQYVSPDIFVYKINDEFVITLNSDGIPRLSLNYYYKNALKANGNFTGDTKKYVEEKIRSASWLLKSIQQRQKTIYKVMESILKFQKIFFENGVEGLQPLILKDVALDIEMHESTISRVTTNKYVHTPQGIFELKYFFNSSINRTDGGTSSSTSVQEKIRQIIKSEDPLKPYTDKKISAILKESNIIIARRTIAKYRESMNFLSSNKRKQF